MKRSMADNWFNFNFFIAMCMIFISVSIVKHILQTIRNEKKLMIIKLNIINQAVL